MTLAAAWAELRAATPPGWYDGTPVLRHGGQWEMYAYDTTENTHIRRRSREWTAVGLSDEDCVMEMARCLREIGARRVPTYENKEGTSHNGPTCPRNEGAGAGTRTAVGWSEFRVV